VEVGKGGPHCRDHLFEVVAEVRLIWVLVINGALGDNFIDHIEVALVERFGKHTSNEVLVLLDRHGGLPSIAFIRMIFG